MSLSEKTLLALTGSAYAVLGYILVRNWLFYGISPSWELIIAFVASAVAWFLCYYQFFHAILANPQRTMSAGTALTILGIICLTVIESYTADFLLI